jgi:vesicular inhibitory amino acid transporter
METETDLKIDHDMKNSHKIGQFKSVVNIVLTAVGVGVLALPRAIAQSGWAIGVLLLLLTWGLSQFCMHLLWKCVQSQREKGNVELDSYGGVGHAALGRVGRIFVSISMYTGLSAICIIILILLGSGLYNLTGKLDLQDWIKVGALCILPLSWLPSLKEVGVLSAVGVVATVLVSLVIFIASVVRESDDANTISATPVSAGAFAMSYIEFMNSYVVAPVIPTIICGMKDPSKYPRVAMYGFAIITVLFGIIGFSGYAGWGSSLLSKKGGNITDLIAESTQSEIGKTFSTICQVAIVVVALSHFLVIFNPVALLSDSGIGLIAATKRSTVAKLALQIIARSMIVGLMLLAALYVPSFGTVVDLVAATVVLPLQVIFPIVFYEILCRQEIENMHLGKRVIMRTIFVLAIGIALVTMGYGLYSVITTWSA